MTIRRKLVLALSLGLLFGGCAAGPIPAVVVSGPSTPCVPPEMAPFGAWRPGPVQVMAVEDEDGRAFPAVRRAYQMPDGTVAVALWAEGRMLLVDPAPDNPEIAAWVDRGLVAGSGTNIALRRDRHTRIPCQWRTSGGASA